MYVTYSMSDILIFSNKWYDFTFSELFKLLIGIRRFDFQNEFGRFECLLI